MYEQALKEIYTDVTIIRHLLVCSEKNRELSLVDNAVIITHNNLCHQPQTVFSDLN